MGAISDTRAKRRPFFLIGFIFWAITTAIFPFASLISSIILAITIAIVFAYDATFNTYITDIRTNKNRGKAVELVEIMTLVAILVVYGISGLIILTLGYFNFFYIVGIIVGIFGITGALLAKEPENLTPQKVSFATEIKNTFKTDILKSNRNFFLVLTGAAFWGIGFNIFFPFIIIYLQHYMDCLLRMLRFRSSLLF